MRFKDIFDEFVAPKLVVRRDDWDNLSDDVLYLDYDAPHPQWQKDRAKKLHKMLMVASVEKHAHESFETCRRLCDSTKDCFQFAFHDGVCAYHKSFMLGKPAKKAEVREDQKDEIWVSGWNVNRIRSWIRKQGRCQEPVWPEI